VKGNVPANVSKYRMFKTRGNVSSRNVSDVFTDAFEILSSRFQHIINSLGGGDKAINILRRSQLVICLGLRCIAVKTSLPVLFVLLPTHFIVALRLTEH